MIVNFSRFFSRMRYLLRSKYNIKAKVMQMAGTRDSGKRAGSVMCRKKQIDRDPDYFSMTAEEIHEFLVSLTPDVTPEEIESMNHRVYSRIMARIQQEDQKRNETLKRKRRRVWAVAVICSLPAVSAIAHALGISIWDTVVRWTEEHFSMQFFPSPESTMAMSASNESFSVEERNIWGDEVCDTLMDMNCVPDLPTWKPEGFQQEMIAREDIPNEEFSLSLIIAVYRSNSGQVLTLSVEELPVTNSGYDVELEKT